MSPSSSKYRYTYFLRMSVTTSTYAYKYFLRKSTSTVGMRAFHLQVQDHVADVYRHFLSGRGGKGSGVPGSY